MSTPEVDVVKSRWLTVTLILFVFIPSGCHNAAFEEHESGTPALKGPYLGMNPPGDVPELFAPGVVSDVFWEHSGAVFSPDGKELFWSVAINEGRTPRIVVILHMQQEDGLWTRPELAPFNRATYNHVNSISPDGQRLYFFSSSHEEPSMAWIVEKTEIGWGEPEALRLNTIDHPDTVVNEVHEARSGTLYFSGPLATLPGGRGIVRSRLKDGKYQDYESLGRHVNSPHSDRFPNHSPTVDPDERFVVFASNRPGGFGEYDLYVSFRQPDGTWGPAQNLGPEINTVGTSTSWPQLSPDGRFLFFVSSSRPLADFAEKDYSYVQLKQIQQSIMNGWGNIYWVSTSFVDELKPAEGR
jgi:hypothetical protein